MDGSEDEEDLPEDIQQIMQMMDEIERQMSFGGSAGIFDMFGPMMMQAPTTSSATVDMVDYELSKDEKDKRFEQIKEKQRANADNSSDSSLSIT